MGSICYKLITVSSLLQPWEVSQVQNTQTQILQSHANDYLSSKVQVDSIEVNGNTSVPWWQKKNVKITEIHNENEYNTTPYSAPSSQQQPVKRTWVPPMPPPIAMPEAAEAIRRPKSVAQKEQVQDDKSEALSSDISGDEQNIPKTSESESFTDNKELSSMSNTGEIQTAQEVN